MGQVITGQCLCGAVRYQVTGPLSEAHACHCGQCRRQSGHFVVATGAKRADFALLSAETLKWYLSSPGIKRGFCSECGTVMFWDDGGDEMSINAGNLDNSAGLQVTSHIFVADKPDYYDIEDNLPQFATYPET